jgi:hypothetical protein
MAKVKWNARKAEVSIAISSSISIDSSATAYPAQFVAASATNASAYIKDVSITPPEMEVEIVHTLGQDTNLFQNSYDEEKPSGMAKMTATLIMQGDEIFETGMTGVTQVSGFTDYMYNPDKRDNKSYLVNFNDNTDTVSILFHDAYIKLGERKPTGIDGHWEQSIELICSPQNYREQFKD